VGGGGGVIQKTWLITLGTAATANKGSQKFDPSTQAKKKLIQRRRVYGVATEEFFTVSGIKNGFQQRKRLKRMGRRPASKINLLGLIWVLSGLVPDQHGVHRQKLRRQFTGFFQ